MLPTNFTAEEYRSIMSKVNPRLYKSLRETFIVINDDLEKVNGSSNQRSGNRSGSRASSTVDSEVAEVNEVTPASGPNQQPVGSSSRGSKRQNSSTGSAGSKRSQH